MDFTREIVDEAYRRSTWKSVRSITESMGVPYTTVWNQLKNKRRWQIENWLLILNRLGVVHVRGDELVIKSKLVRKLKGFV